MLTTAALVLALATAPAPRFHGIIVPMITPFDAKGEHIDLEAMRQHTRWLLDKPVAMLFPICGLGQWRDLGLDEKKAIIRTVTAAAHGKIPVVPGITSPKSLDETIALGTFAATTGASAVGVAIPDYLRPKDGAPSQAALFDFYKSVATALPLPILIYDAQADLNPETMQRLAALPNIKAVKYRTKDIERFERMVAAVGDRIAVFAGVEHMGVAALAAGAAGIVGGGANIFPQLIDKVFQRFRAGDIKGARAATFALIKANDGVPGGQEIKYALRTYYGLAMSEGRRGTQDVPLTIGEKDGVDRAIVSADPKLGATELGRLRAALAEKRRRYLTLTASVHDADGFVHNKCDGVTFTGLSCIARGLDKKDCPVYKARDAKEPGLWFRHAKHDCFDLDGKPGGSRSDNSPDVFTTLALVFWHYHDLEAVSAVIDYGERHGWIMGRARPGAEAETVAWSDDMKALFYELRFRLGGPDHPQRQKLSRHAELGDGWHARVAAGRLLLVALITGQVTEHEIAAAHALAATEPDNALYQALLARLADGPMARPYRLLLDARHFPERALPDNHENHCAEYLFERSEHDGTTVNDNWLPCKDRPRRVHSGTDFLWAACVLTPGCLVTNH